MKLIVLLVFMSNYLIFEAAPSEDRAKFENVGIDTLIPPIQIQIDGEEKTPMIKRSRKNDEDTKHIVYRGSCMKFVVEHYEEMKAWIMRLLLEKNYGVASLMQEYINSCRAHSRKKRDLGELWERVKTHVDDASTRFSKSKEDLRSKWAERFQKIRDSYNEMNSLALEFITYSREMKAEFIRESRDLFRSHDRLFATLWDNIKKYAKEAID